MDIEIDKDVQSVLSEELTDPVATKQKYTDALSAGTVAIQDMLDVVNEILDDNAILMGSESVSAVLEHLERTKDMLGALSESDLDFLIETNQLYEVENIFDRVVHTLQD